MNPPTTSTEKRSRDKRKKNYDFLSKYREKETLDVNISLVSKSDIKKCSIVERDAG